MYPRITLAPYPCDAQWRSVAGCPPVVPRTPQTDAAAGDVVEAAVRVPGQPDKPSRRQSRPVLPFVRHGAPLTAAFPSSLCRWSRRELAGLRHGALPPQGRHGAKGRPFWRPERLRPRRGRGCRPAGRSLDEEPDPTKTRRARRRRRAGSADAGPCPQGEEGSGATDARPQMPSHRRTNRVRTNRQYQSSAPALKNSMPMCAACSCRPMANFPTTGVGRRHRRS